VSKNSRKAGERPLDFTNVATNESVRCKKSTKRKTGGRPRDFECGKLLWKTFSTKTVNFREKTSKKRQKLQKNAKKRSKNNLTHLAQITIAQNIPHYSNFKILEKV
jgi:hypothetical protein